jgi:hypothetical protein
MDIKGLFVDFQPTSIAKSKGMLALRIRRKQFYALNTSFKLLGCFDDVGYGRDCILSILAVVLEFIGLSIIYAQSQDIALVYVLLFTIFLDIISALLLHGSKGKQNVAENDAFVNVTIKNKRKATMLKIFGSWGNVPVGFILLWACALLKASYAFGVTRALGPAIGIGLAVVYIVIAYIYQFHTGDFIAGWLFRHNVKKDYEDYQQAISQKQPSASEITHYKITRLTFPDGVAAPTQNILIYKDKVDTQEIKHGIGKDANGKWILQTWGYLFDTDISSLLSTVDDNTKIYLFKECVAIQLFLLQHARIQVAYTQNDLIAV